VGAKIPQTVGTLRRF